MPNNSNIPFQSLSEIIPFLCKRPMMFVPHGTWREAFCFLHGFVCAEETRSSAFYEEWRLFHRWMQRKLQVPPSCGWSTTLESMVATDEAAFQLLLELFQEFERHTNSPR